MRELNLFNFTFAAAGNFFTLSLRPAAQRLPCI